MPDRSGIVEHASAVSERAFPDAPHGIEQAAVRRVRRPRMRDRVTIGQTWIRRQRGRARVSVQIRQVHRSERRVEVTDGAGQRFHLTFGELRLFQLQTDDTAAA